MHLITTVPRQTTATSESVARHRTRRLAAPALLAGLAIAAAMATFGNGASHPGLDGPPTWQQVAAHQSTGTDASE